MMVLPEHSREISYFFREVILLTNDDLIDELTDHFSAGIEEQMSQGKNFSMALHDTFEAFGGREGLQRMERNYNQITFRRFDAIWKETISLQFKASNLWVTMGVYIGIFLVTLYGELPTGKKANAFFDGFPTGLLLGGMVVSLNSLLPYLKDRLYKGPHNPQSENWYLFKRGGVATALFYGIGLLATESSISFHPALIALYFTLLFIFLKTQGITYRHLYNLPQLF